MYVFDHFVELVLKKIFFTEQLRTTASVNFKQVKDMAETKHYLLAGDICPYYSEEYSEASIQGCP